ncbi:MAG: response regulator [Candidatus Zixiibacteriota bacterium]
MYLQNILVVEDEAIVAASIQASLIDMGFENTEIALSIKDAFEKTTEKKLDLIIMDIKLGENLDGIEAAQKIKQAMDIPIIYLTAYSEPELLERAKNSLPYGLLLKPYNERELKVAIEIALTRHQLMQDHRKMINKLSKMTMDKNDDNSICICANCKSIRDNGTWVDIESYFSEKYNLKFSHTLCKKCATFLYPELYNDKKGLN